jgi:HEAT repeat protein
MTNVNRLAAASLLVSLCAWAQVDAGTVKVPAPKGPPKVLGSLKILGSAKEDDEPAKAAACCNDADAGLLHAVLYAFEPAPTEIRVIAIEDLGILGDPRALNPLAQLVMDPNPAVQMAAVRAIGAIQHPRAEAILANIVRHPSISERVKMLAIESVVFQNSATSMAFLDSLTRTSSQIHPILKQQAELVLSKALGRSK